MTWRRLTGSRIVIDPIAFLLIAGEGARAQGWGALFGLRGRCRWGDTLRAAMKARAKRHCQSERVGILLAGTLLSLFLTPAFAQTPEPAAIRVVMDNNYPPFAFLNGAGKLQGILVDEWRLWEAKTGIKVEIQGMDWGQALERMKAGEFDVIDTIFKTSERTTFYDFSRPYARIDVPVFFRKEIAGITDLKSLGGFLVAAKQGDATVDLLAKQGVTNVVLFTNYEAIVQAARDLKVNVFLVDDPPALYFLNKLGIRDEFRRTAPVNTAAFHRAVKKGDTVVLTAVERGFAAIDPAELRRIKEKWYGGRVDSVPGLRFLGYSAAGVAALVLGLMAWTIALNRLVNRRTSALQESQSRLRALLDHIPDLVWLKDTQSTYITANVRFAEAAKCTVEALAGRKVSDLMSETEARQIATVDQTVIQTGQASRVMQKRLDSQGNVRWYDTIKAPVRNAEGVITGIVGIGRDITERKQAEAELQRVNRTLRMISECNQVLVRATDETDLLQSVCRLIVESGGYRMVWVGFAMQDEAKSVRPVARAGFDEGYVDALKLTWADAERGRGPTGVTIRTRQPVIARNIATESTFGPWRQAAMERGYAASGSFPLVRDDRVLGALMVYSSEAGVFDSEEVELLNQLAGDVAFGVMALRTRIVQERVEQELRILSAHLLEVQDLERRHLARELHDTTAQHLAALTLNLSNLKRALDSAPESSRTLCQDSIQLANQAAQEIRTHSYLLHPPLLDALGLAGAVEDYAQGFSARSGIKVEVNTAADFGRLPEALELALFRVVQESLANVLKHSHSPRAEIRFTRDGLWYMLEIEDMGQGIPQEKLALITEMRGGLGVGLGGMQQRLKLLGGRLELESDSGGTLVRAVVPVHPNMPDAHPPSASPL